MKNINSKAALLLVFIFIVTQSMERRPDHSQLILKNDSGWTINVGWRDKKGIQQSATLPAGQSLNFDTLKNAKELQISTILGAYLSTTPIQTDGLNPADTNEVTIQSSGTTWGFSYNTIESPKIGSQILAERNSRFLTTMSGYIDLLKSEVAAQESAAGFRTIGGELDPSHDWKIEQTKESSDPDLVERTTKPLQAVESAIIGLKKIIPTAPHQEAMILKPMLTTKIAEFEQALEQQREALNVLLRRTDDPDYYYGELSRTYNANASKIPNIYGIHANTFYRFLGLSNEEGAAQSASQIRHIIQKKKTHVASGTPQEQAMLFRQLEYTLKDPRAKQEYDAFLAGPEAVKALSADLPEVEELKAKTEEIGFAKRWLNGLKNDLDRIAAE